VYSPTATHDVVSVQLTEERTAIEKLADEALPGSGSSKPLAQVPEVSATANGFPT
jgi:hypothetical protein